MENSLYIKIGPNSITNKIFPSKVEKYPESIAFSVSKIGTVRPVNRDVPPVFPLKI